MEFYVAEIYIKDVCEDYDTIHQVIGVYDSYDKAEKAIREDIKNRPEDDDVWYDAVVSVCALNGNVSGFLYPFS